MKARLLPGCRHLEAWCYLAGERQHLHLCVAPDVRVGRHELAVLPGTRGQDPASHHPRSLLPGSMHGSRPAPVLDIGSREQLAGHHPPPALPRPVNHLPRPAPAWRLPDKPTSDQMCLPPLHDSPQFSRCAALVSLYLQHLPHGHLPPPTAAPTRHLSSSFPSSRGSIGRLVPVVVLGPQEAAGLRCNFTVFFAGRRKYRAEE